MDAIVRCAFNLFPKVIRFHCMRLCTLFGYAPHNDRAIASGAPFIDAYRTLINSSVRVVVFGKACPLSPTNHHLCFGTVNNIQDHTAAVLWQFSEFPRFDTAFVFIFQSTTRRDHQPRKWYCRSYGGWWLCVYSFCDIHNLISSRKFDGNATQNVECALCAYTRYNLRAVLEMRAHAITTHIAHKLTVRTYYSRVFVYHKYDIL